ncbi:MAG: phage terminase large subunit [Terriglobales bacterium]
MSTLNNYRQILRQDFSGFIERSFRELNPQTDFVSNWHIRVMAHELEKCRHGWTKRLIINIPPRSLKSISVSVAFIAWLLGHQPSSQIMAVSYAQDLANKLSLDCRSVMLSRWYQELFNTRLSTLRQAVPEFMTTERGVRLATSVGGVLTGRGADYIIIDDPLKPEEALSATQRKTVNDSYDHTLYSRLNDKDRGCIIVIMQRLHEDDLVGHLLNQGEWKVLRFPAIAEEDEQWAITTATGQTRRFKRNRGEALHAGRESLDALKVIRETLGEYNFAGQYQQSPAPLGGGLVKAGWFKTYTELPTDFELIFQSWDTANKATELSDHSVCTTWGTKDKNLYLLHVLRKRLDYPNLKRAVAEQALAFNPRNIVIEDKASGTQLIQELIEERVHGVSKYEPTADKVVRMNTVTSTMENGFVYLPEKAEWLAEYLHELTTFPNGKFDDQADSTSQALDWFKQNGGWGGIFGYWKEEYEKTMNDPNHGKGRSFDFMLKRGGNFF